ncbi:MAG: undecaprenyldiphospho-muramoylpentapeptide beta-N-acetylglucosaminyltransferase [Candidatus Entotheonellia bacterium]
MRIVIVGGGTGGHLYPGIAVAHELQRFDPYAAITFIGSKAAGEREIVLREGFAFSGITASGFTRRKPSERMLSVAHLIRGILQSIRILREVRPSMVLGLGSYVSGPAVLAARGLRIPCVIQEQNLLPGLTNRTLGRIANRIAVSFDDSVSYFSASKVIVTGNPVRAAIREVARSDPQPNGRFHLLLFGGSQGAHRLNSAMVQALPLLTAAQEALWVVHQTGQDDFSTVQKAYTEMAFPGVVRPYIQDIAQEYRTADLVICRAGASTIAELTVCGRPALLVPFPYAANQHQEHNARVLVSAGAAKPLPDHELSGELLAEQIGYHLQHPEEVTQMAAHSRALGKPDAAVRVAQLCLEVCRL